MESEFSSLRLGVNIDHVATLRQARGTAYPSVVEAAKLCEASGAHGITVHLREDRRHIQDQDVHALKDVIGIPLNLEMSIHRAILTVALAVNPSETCLVPERREELTTEGGLDVKGQFDDVRDCTRRLLDAGIEVSLFIDPVPEQVAAVVETGAKVIEFHTGAFCNASGAAAEGELLRLVTAAGLAHDAGLRINAGHGIHLGNIGRVLDIPHLDTLNIGHSIVSRAVFVGMKNAVREMLAAMAPYGGQQ